MKGEVKETDKAARRGESLARGLRSGRILFRPCEKKAGGSSSLLRKLCVYWFVVLLFLLFH